MLMAWCCLVIAGPVATAFDVCVTKLLAHVDVAPQAHVIGLVHAGLQLWACHLARITTHESQSGRLLVAACKRLFMQSKDPANDERFCHVTVVETLLGVLSSQCAHSVPTQALIYVAGVLKNVSGSARMVTLLSTNGAIAVFSKALQVTFDKDVNAAAQVLVQVTAILRNLAEHKQCLKQFWHAHVIQALCDLLPAYASHGELVLNVSRILSKLTLHEAGRTQVNKGKHNLRHLLKLLDGDTRSRQQDAALVIRLAFILGNLTATNDRNRKAIVTLGAVPPLVRMLKEYHIRYVHESPDNDTSATTAEDVLVKLVRLLANAAIHTSVGPMLGTVPGIEVLLDVLDHAKVARHEELMLNVVSCLTNLSFYSTDATPTNVITVHRHRLSRDLASILVDPNDEAVVEAARAFGNLSRFPDVLGAMLDPDSAALLPTFVMLLDHANRDVVYTVCGVLMNAALDKRTRGNLHAVPTTHDVVDTRDLLVRLFRHAGLKDLAMSTMLCKVLFNLVLSTAPSDTAATYVDTSTGRLLLTTLEELVDAMADSATEAEVEFASVAHALMRSLVK
ncbi:hypothetical protein DYB34_001218 [Aphanomyces astaci]|uniref:Armadillo repeat-containing domain-containing protein n=2 Tax=Aphanomyces astaci TaxID=112090 RepID=A0A3R6WV72_APHAT|nr:hypothetical protein DYB34_001218 [Aphanomyces astaci]